MPTTSFVRLDGASYLRFLLPSLFHVDRRLETFITRKPPYTSISGFLNDMDSSGPSPIASPSPIMFPGFGVPNDVRIAPASRIGLWAAVHFIRSHRSRSFSHQPRTSPDFRLRFLCWDRLDSGAFVPPGCNSFGTWIDPEETNAVNRERNT